MAKEKAMTEKEMRDWIRDADYYSLLHKWRFAAPGLPWFQGNVGKYYKKMLIKRRRAVGHSIAAAISKRVGL